MEQFFAHSVPVLQLSVLTDLLVVLHAEVWPHLRQVIDVVLITGILAFLSHRHRAATLHPHLIDHLLEFFPLLLKAFRRRQLLDRELDIFIRLKIFQVVLNAENLQPSAIDAPLLSNVQLVYVLSNGEGSCVDLFRLDAGWILQILQRLCKMPVGQLPHFLVIDVLLVLRIVVLVVLVCNALCLGLFRRSLNERVGATVPHFIRPEEWAAGHQLRVEPSLPIVALNCSIQVTGLAFSGVSLLEWFNVQLESLRNL